MFRRLIATAPTWAMLPLRLALGTIFIAHGVGKVFGYGGPGLSKFLSGQTPFSFMQPAKFWLGAAALSEFVGGLLVLYGLLTRVGAFFIACTMLTAMAGVHWSGGFFMPRGIEFTVALFGMSLALLISGGGRDSVDEMLTSHSRDRMTMQGLIARVVGLAVLSGVVLVAFNSGLIRQESLYMALAALGIALIIYIVNLMRRP